MFLIFNLIFTLKIAPNLHHDVGFSGHIKVYVVSNAKQEVEMVFVFHHHIQEF
jgi:hypothetical protein